MPMTDKGRKIMGAMKHQYGADKGEHVFYASANKGTIEGVHKTKTHAKAPRTRETSSFATMRARR